MFTGKRNKLEPKYWWAWVAGEGAALAAAVLLMLGFGLAQWGGALLIMGVMSWVFRIYNYEVKR